MSENVFTTAFYVVLGIAVATIVARRFFPQVWFWASLVGALLGTVLGVLRFKLRFFETLEAGVFGLLPWLSIVFLADSVRTSRASSLIGFFFFLFLIGLFSFLDSKYKGFSWYKSGRVGFAGLVVVGFTFLVRTGLAVVFEDVLSLVGKGDAFLSGVVAFAAFLLLFNLARSS